MIGKFAKAHSTVSKQNADDSTVDCIDLHIFNGHISILALNFP